MNALPPRLELALQRLRHEVRRTLIVESYAIYERAAYAAVLAWQERDGDADHCADRAIDEIAHLANGAKLGAMWILCDGLGMQPHPRDNEDLLAALPIPPPPFEPALLRKRLSRLSTRGLAMGHIAPKVVIAELHRRLDPVPGLLLRAYADALTDWAETTVGNPATFMPGAASVASRDNRCQSPSSGPPMPRAAGPQAGQ